MVNEMEKLSENFFLSANKLNITADSENCKTCKSSCCCSYIDAADYIILCLPEDFAANEEDLEESVTQAVKSGLFRVCEYDDALFVAPVMKKRRKRRRIQCVFLSDSGCILVADERPASCRMVEVQRHGDCPIHLDMDDVEEAWKPHVDFLSSLP